MSPQSESLSIYTLFFFFSAMTFCAFFLALHRIANKHYILVYEKFVPHNIYSVFRHDIT